MSTFQIIIFGKWKNMSKSLEFDQPIQVTSGTERVIMIFFECFMKGCKLFSYL